MEEAKLESYLVGPYYFIIIQTILLNMSKMERHISFLLEYVAN